MIKLNQLKINKIALIASSVLLFGMLVFVSLRSMSTLEHLDAAFQIIDNKEIHITKVHRCIYLDELLNLKTKRYSITKDDFLITNCNIKLLEYKKETNDVSRFLKLYLDKEEEAQYNLAVKNYLAIEGEINKLVNKKLTNKVSLALKEKKYLISKITLRGANFSLLENIGEVIKKEKAKKALNVLEIKKTIRLDLVVLVIIVAVLMVLLYLLLNSFKKLDKFSTKLKKINEIYNIGSWEYIYANNELIWDNLTKEIHQVEKDYEPNIDEAILFYKEEYRTKIVDIIKDSRDNNQPWDEELQIITNKTKELIWVRAKGEAKIVNGKCVKIFGTFENINDRKLAELEAEENRENLSLLMSSVSMGNFTYNIKEGRITWSEGVFDLFEINEEEFDGKIETYINTIVPEEQDKIQKLITVFILEGKHEQPIEYEHSILVNEGGIKKVNVKCNLFLDDENHPIKFVGIIRDITKEWEAKRQLEKSEEKYRSIFNSFTDIYYEADAEGKMEIISPSVEEIMGYEVKDLIGIEITKHYKFPKQREELIEKLEKKGEVKNFETVLYNKTGDEVLIEANIFYRRDIDGKINGVKGTFRNINDKDRLIKVTQQLEEKDTLLKEIHHRVKNNLQVITGLLSLQSRFIEEERVKALFRYAQYRINSMSVIHEMLYQSENISQINYSIYINKLIHDLLHSMQGVGTEIEIEINIPDIFFNIDTSIPLGLLINEIVTNAFKYGIPNGKGKLTVELRELENSRYIINIGDDGVGFSDDINFKNSKSLGLKLIQKLALQLKGSVEKDDTQKGTHYQIYFQEIEQVL